MVKRIETTQYLADQSAEYLVREFTINGGTANTKRNMNIVLMTGPSPFADENFLMSNFQPKAVRVPNDIKIGNVYDDSEDEAVGGIIQSYVAETKTITFNIYGNPPGFTATATATITENSYSVGNLVTPGPVDLTDGNWASFFKTEDPQYRYALGVANLDIKVNILKDGVIYERTVLTPAFLQFYNDEDILVKWRGRRIYSEGNALSTYADVATRSGTATWFFGRFYPESGNQHQAVIIGTVGLPESDSDLELNDLEIVQGKTYGINNLRINLPTVFEY